MRLSQFILIPLAAGIIALIFFVGRTRFTPDSEGNMKNMPKPAINNMTVSATGFDHVLKMANSLIKKEVKDSLSTLTAEVEKADGKQKEKLLKDLSKMWARTGNFICAGHYLKGAADISDSTSNWKEAAEVLELSLNGAGDSLARTYAINEAINCYEHVIKKDTADTESKIHLALFYIDGVGGPMTMNGVLLLKDVEKKDSDNEIMNLTLGRLAIVSGQFDKAITRLEKLVKKHPDNREAYYHLYEAFRATGKKDDAIKMLEKCKSLLSDSPDAIKQLNQLITDIKKS